MDSVIKNGTVVTAAGISKADVGIEDGKVVAIGASLDAGGARTIDAAGCYVIPGGIGVHTHLDTPGFNARTADDFATGTRAAACGGTTTIVDFCQQDHGQSHSPTRLASGARTRAARPRSTMASTSSSAT